MAHRIDYGPEPEGLSSWLVLALAYLFLVWVLWTVAPTLR